jgi:hypothetical protein
MLRSTLYFAVAEPLPAKAMVRGESEALLVKVALPEKLPAVDGANTTLNLVD